VELIMAIALSSMLALVVYGMMTAQNRAYSLQDDSAEMQQNLRVAAERISRDLKMAGFGKPAWSTINQADASSWYNSANGYRAYNISGGGDSYAIDIVGCIDASATQLSAATAYGSTTLTLPTGDAARFNTTTKQDINIGSSENAKVRTVSGNSLTIDTDPVAAENQGVAYDHGTGAVVCLVKWVTYSRGTDNVLYVNQHQGAGNEPVAQSISLLTFSVTGKTVTFTLRGTSSRPDRTTGQYVTGEMTGKVFLRN
jgi:Tfp pilus assembly protein PilW